MKSYLRTEYVSRWMTGLVACLAVGMTAANDTAWINASGGSFEDPNNWSAGVPSIADAAVFGLDATYTVSFASQATVKGADVADGDVTWNLGTFGISDSTNGNFYVGRRPGESAALTLVGGETVASHVYLGQGGTGDLVLTDGAQLHGTVSVGAVGASTLRIEDGSHWSGFGFLIGGAADNDQFGVGHATIAESNSAAVVSNMFLFNGTLTVESGALLQTAGISGGGGPDSPVLTVTGAGSTYACLDWLALGSDGPMATVIDNGASLDSSKVTLGGSFGGATTLDVTNATWQAAYDVEVRDQAIVTIAGASVVEIAGPLEIFSGGTVNLNGGTLRVGAFENEGTFNWNSGTFEVTGTLGLVVGGDGGPDELRVQNGQTLSVNHDVQVADGGAVQVAPGGAIDAGGTIRVSSGGALALGGIASAAEIALDGDGVLSGAGQTVGLLSNGGRIEPGFSPGILTHEGDYEQLAAGLLAIELAGLASFDVLAISGAADLAGRIEVALLGDFQPKLGDSFEILTASSVTGEFAQWQLPSLESELRWSIDYAADGVTLGVVAVPEPASLAYAACAATALAIALRRRSTAVRWS